MEKRSKVVDEARERYARARDYWAPIYAQVRQDLDFSDPTDPKQWPEKSRKERESNNRPCFTFDLIGQFVRQVVNTARRNKPAIKYLPVDDKSDPRAAEVLQGLARQTEYASRADVAYIQALDHATRGGLGFFRMVLEKVKNSEVKDQQCAKIMRVPDFETVLLDPDYTEPDGSDAMWGFVEESMSRALFAKKYPEAKVEDFDPRGWSSKENVRVVDYYRVVDRSVNVVAGEEVTEAQLKALLAADPTIESESKETRVVEVYKLNGEEILPDEDGGKAESEFPAEFVPIFPVIGNETWKDGKRFIGGCVRTARDSQISYNLARNAEAEAVAIGPKAPWEGPAEAIEGLEDVWKQANSGNIGYLPWNHLDEQGNPLPKPTRVQPAGMQPGWVQLREASKSDVQAALGMFEATVGNNPNSQSGRAVIALQDKADVGSYHYVDNLALSISHCGRVLTQIWPRIYDQAQIIRILGDDDEPEFVAVDPEQQQAYQERQTAQGQQIVINPNVGKYDVRVTVGPSFQTRSAEAAQEIGNVINGNPALFSLIGDVWLKMRNFPEADKIERRLKAMLPPQVQAAEGDGPQELPPEVTQALQAAQQEIQQLQAALQEAQSGVASQQMDAELKLRIAAMSEETKRYVADTNNDTKRDMEELKGLISLLVQKMQPPPVLASEVAGDFAEFSQ